jgi:hypothetical protein
MATRFALPTFTPRRRATNRAIVPPLTNQEIGFLTHMADELPGHSITHAMVLATRFAFILPKLISNI